MSHSNTLLELLQEAEASLEKSIEYRPYATPNFPLVDMVTEMFRIALSRYRAAR